MDYPQAIFDCYFIPGKIILDNTFTGYIWFILENFVLVLTIIIKSSPISFTDSFDIFEKKNFNKKTILDITFVLPLTEPLHFFHNPIHA